MERPVLAPPRTPEPPKHAHDYAYRAWGCEAPHTAGYIWPQALSWLAELKPGATILDAGCGNGTFAAQLGRHGYRVIGVDLSESGVAAARVNCPTGTFHVASIYNDFGALGVDAVDAVVSLEVIEHLYDPLAYLQNCARVLKPGGKLVLSTPYHGWLKNVVMALGGRFDSHAHPWKLGGHIKFFSKRSITALMHEAGLNTEQTIGTRRLPWLWMSMVVRATPQSRR